MAILRKRRGRTSAASPEILTPTPAKPVPTGAKLEERLREIAAGAPPEETLEPALQAILEASGVQAGALCLFDARHNIMRLAAEQGLSEEGCARLRSVRRGDPSSWDMPLHGLLNRRAYLIENAPRNRYVPPLVEHFESVRSVACVPVYGNANPIGTLIMIAFAPRSFVERDIHALERPLRELARMIEAARRRGGVADEPETAPRAPAVTDVVAILTERDRLRDEVTTRQAERASLAAELAVRVGENDHLRFALEQAGGERQRLAAELERSRCDADRVATLSSALAAAERERARLVAALEAAAAGRAEETQRLIAVEEACTSAEKAAASALADLDATRRVLGASAAAAGARATELGAEVERLQARLTEAEAAVTQERSRLHEREAEQQRLARELQEAAAREHRLRTELSTTTERVGSDEQPELRNALVAVQAAEEARGAALADAAMARDALASTQAVVQALEDEASRAHAEVERLTAAERAACAAQQRLEEELAAVRESERQTSARLAEIEQEVGALRAERGHLSTVSHEHEATLVAHAARLETLAAERDRLDQKLATVTTQRDRLVADASAATGARARLEEALERETTERSRLGAALGDLQAALGRLESTQARHEAEATARSAEIDRLRTDCERLTAERDRLLAERPAAVAGEPAPAPEEALDPGTPPVRVVMVAAGGGSRARGRESAAGEDVAAERTIAVLDVDSVWERTYVEGHAVTVITPGEDAVARLVSMPPTRIIANLAAPGVLEAVIGLRAAGSTARVWGCLAASGTDRALALGMIEPATRPLDPEAILAVLAGYATRGTRLITAGADVDALMSLRQALARQGMSVAMAWDAKQAADLMGVVRPEVAVIDLSLPRRDGYAIVAGLAAGVPPPSAILVPGDGDAAAAFAAALADPKRTESISSLERVLSSVVARSEEAPVERRQKVRAIGRGK